MQTVLTSPKATVKTALNNPICSWQKVILGNLVDIQLGFPFSSIQFSENIVDTKLLRGDNIAPGRLRWAGVKRWPTEKLKAVEQYYLRVGDVVLAMDRPWISDGLKQAVVIKDDLPCLLVQRVARLRAKADIEQKFLAVVIASRPFAEQLTSTQTGATAPHITGNDIARFMFLLPPLAEQHAIVEILDEADAAVRATEKLIAAKTKYKTALAEQLLTGKRRFSEFAGQEWRDTKLGEFFREKSQRAPAGIAPVVLSCSKIYGILPQSERFSRQLASRDLTRYKYVGPGDLVFDPMLLWDASLAFSNLYGVVSPAYCTLSFVADDADSRFFHYLFYTHEMRHTYKRISKGTNVRRKKVLASDFLNIKVTIPDLPEQRRIAEVLGLVDKEIELLKRQLTAQKTQKDGLMQVLLTGQKRVKEFAT